MSPTELQRARFAHDEFVSLLQQEGALYVSKERQDSSAWVIRRDKAPLSWDPDRCSREFRKNLYEGHSFSYEGVRDFEVCWRNPKNYNRTSFFLLPFEWMMTSWTVDTEVACFVCHDWMFDAIVALHNDMKVLDTFMEENLIAYLEQRY